LQEYRQNASIIRKPSLKYLLKNVLQENDKITQKKFMEVGNKVEARN
jgi:hypothetical protein